MQVVFERRERVIGCGHVSDAIIGLAPNHQRFGLS